ncbi:M48 family metallopeptidase [Mesorhizobium sp. ESP7-2]|uniref:M48 metallopeptidase family protein n=1 Tax=Mesorhizobium sp. ESP7-2 TaxID=2876622 RepID=UPI00296255FC|nr:M48 family metallopeptidase [Mesorhizobium sp. ESP7-2]
MTISPAASRQSRRRCRGSRSRRHFACSTCCATGGSVTLNPFLVKAPREAIDYVITHELCHLREHNHSPEFFRLLTRSMPGWEAVKSRLDHSAEIILND